MRPGLVIAAVAVLLACAPPTHAAGMPSDDAIFQTIKDLVAHGPRRTGTPALRRAVGYVRDRFARAGLTDVHVEETPTYSWAARAHALTVGDRSVDAFPVAYSLSPAKDAVGDFSTPPGGLKAPLVDGGLGTPAELAGKDVKGKIVVFDLKFLLPQAVIATDSEFMWDPEQTLATDPLNLIVANPYQSSFATAIGAIQDAGAVGFIGVLADYFDSNRYYNELYRSLNVKLPGMWVTKAEGARIRAQIAADPATQGNMVLAVRRAKVQAHAVLGYLPGRSKDTIVVTSHHDSVWDGAVEDGSGAAEVMALADHYGSLPPGSREKSLMFLTFDSHFSGYQMHNAFYYRHFQHRDPARDPYKPVAVVALEHIARHGAQDANGKLTVTDQPEARGVFENLQPSLKAALIQSLVKHDLRRTVVLDAQRLQPIGIPTDENAALLAGYPVASLISGPNYLYDEADTLDKVQKSDLQRVALTFADLIDAMDTTPSDAMGLPPISVVHATPPGSVDAPADEDFSCTPATGGRAVAHLRLRGRTVSFRARRDARVRIRVRYRDGRRRTFTRRVRACRGYRIGVGRGAARALA